MIILDRFLCCINLKSFGKFVGWLGTMLSVLSAYAVFLIVASKSANLLVISYHDRYFGGKVLSQDAYLNAALLIGVLTLTALFHVLLIWGIKYKKSLAVLPYVLLSVILVGALICIMPTGLQLSAANENDAMSWELITLFVFTIIFSVYFALCIYSLYSQIKDEEKSRKNYKNCESVYDV